MILVVALQPERTDTQFKFEQQEETKRLDKYRMYIPTGIMNFVDWIGGHVPCQKERSRVVPSFAQFQKTSLCRIFVILVCV